MIVTNLLFSKFFPRVFSFSCIWPSGRYFSFPCFPTKEKQAVLPPAPGCSYFGVSCVLASHTFGLSALCYCVEAELGPKDACVPACVLTGGDLSTWIKGQNSPLIRNKSHKPQDQSPVSFKDGFMPYELWKMSFSSSRMQLFSPTDSMTVAQKVQLASSNHFFLFSSSLLSLFSCK